MTIDTDICEPIAGNARARSRSLRDWAVRNVRTPVPKFAQAAGVAALAAVAWACTAGGDDVRPPEDDFYFPTGLALSPGGDYVGVVNANSDLRYDSGTMLLVEVEEVRAILDDWLGSGEVPGGRDCAVDRSARHTLRCGAAEVIAAGRGVRIGNFATDIGFQELSSGRARAFIAVRGDPSVTWVDLDPAAGRLFCGDDGDHHRCQDEHRLLRIREDGDLDTLPNEPFGIFVDGGNEYALATHLTTGSVSLIDAPATGDHPVIADVIPGLFLPDAQGIQGAVGVAGRRPGDPADTIYVTSRSESSLRSLYVVRGGDFPELAVGRRLDLRDLGPPANDARGIAFGAGGGRAYVVNRSPPALQMIDTAVDDRGLPANEPLGSVGICRQGSNALVADSGRGERVYVACFRDHEIWVVDPARRSVETIIPVGAGPHALAVSKEDSLLFVTGFLDHTVAVIDLEEGSDTEHRVVLRLGGGGER